MEKIGLWICNSMSWFMKVDERCTDLRRLLQQLDSRVRDMTWQMKTEELKQGKKRKKVVKVYLKQVKRYKVGTEKALANCQESRWKWRRLWWMPCIQQYLREGQELLRKANSYQWEGLTYDELYKRGDKLAVGELIGESAHQHLSSVLKSIDEGAHCIGIYGPAGAGKTNLMKHLYNKVYDDLEGFNAVFWASAGCDKGIQDSVAEAMWFRLDDEDEVRRASLLEERLRDMGPGKIILFLDNVTEEFPAYDLLGIPSPTQRILVFTTPSEDICNRMRCNLKLKIGLLPENEAQDLFIHEAGLKNQGLRTKGVIAGQVVMQCARMPLAIILIARAMTGVKDIREWRNRLDELMGTIENIHDEEGKIVEQLKISYYCLNDKTAQHCFLASARLLTDNCQVPKQDIINQWIYLGLIRSRLDPQIADDQGHTIMNRLQRMCLLEVASVNGRNMVRMTKWIRKMAATMSYPDS